MNVLLGAFDTVEKSHAHVSEGYGKENYNGAFKIGAIVRENGDRSRKE